MARGGSTGFWEELSGARGSLLAPGTPPTCPAWQMLGFLDVLHDSPARMGYIPNTPGREDSPSLNLASLPEPVLFWALWSRGVVSDSQA